MFVKIYNSLFDYGLKPKELMVFLFLSYCQNCLGTATVRNATIQQRCGLSENTIRSAVAGLEQKGLLVVSARQDRDGRRISNQYKLLQLSGAWGKLPVEAFNLDKRDFAVYTYLCRCSNGQRKAFPSFSHMATVLHMAIGTVQTAIKSLVAAGRLLKAAFRAGKTCTYSSKRWHGRSQGPILAHKKKTAVLEHGGKLEILQKRPLHIFSTN